MVTSSSDSNLILPDKLSITEVTLEAFAILGECGIIRSPNRHECSECTHTYRATTDLIAAEDPAAVVGIDENRAVPTLEQPDDDYLEEDLAAASPAD